MNSQQDNENNKQKEGIEASDIDQLKELIETLPAVVWITDAEGYCTYLNKNWYSYTGQSAGEAEGFGWLDAIHPDDRTGAEESFISASQDHKEYTRKYRLKTSDGEYRWVLDTGRPRFSSSGEFIGMTGTVVDVNEDMMKSQVIREMGHRARTIVEEATVATAIYTGHNMKIELANDAMLAIWGKDRSVVGKPLMDALPEIAGQPFMDLLRKVYSTGEIYWGKEDRADLMVDGVLHTGYYNFTYKPLRNEKGEIYGILNMAIDVTEQRLVRMKVEESEHRYHEIIHASPSLIVTFEGKDNIIKIANEAIIDVWGKGRDVLEKPFLELLPELREQGFGKYIDQVYQTGKPFRAYEMPVDLVRFGKKETRYYSFVLYPQRDIDGNIFGIVGSATEVTPQAIVNKRLKESESHYRQMADLMPEKVIKTDSEGNVIYFNQHWLDFTGLTSDELEKEGWTDRIHKDDKVLFDQQWKRSIDSGDDFEVEIRIRNKDGDYKWHLSRAEAVKDETGNIKMWIGTNTDIQRLKEEEKRKEDFLKVVSHELKTPVTSIKGYVQLLLAMVRSEKEQLVGKLPLRSSLERIDHQINRLTRLISEMLDLTRIEEKKLELQMEEFNLNDLVTQTVQDINYTNTQHDIEISHEDQCMVYGDKDRIGQVVINLVTNAIKYSPESHDVKVRIYKPSEDKVTVSVIDNGVGIEAEKLPRIFERFYRIVEEEEDTYSGFGIGLYLVQEIVERHNGTTDVKSVKGEGSEFSFTLSLVNNK
ncbi:PAS domain-containing sensor histidine kinase [Salinimicrobium gaetbulicola]|uniref:histidine kinase n=1 Tax=Salinimicrobium gaetbulicola TaxID=999702 RepID=A0ABW3IEP7_9FLAO